MHRKSGGAVCLISAQLTHRTPKSLLQLNSKLCGRFHFLGVSQNSLSLMMFVVLILIDKLLFDRFNAKLSTIFPMFFKCSSTNLPLVQRCQLLNL